MNAAQALPEKGRLSALVEKTLAVLAAEAPEIRPRDRLGRPGGLVRLPNQPTILVPDIHARPAFLEKLLQWSPPGSGASVEKLLAREALSLVCLGDAFHSEWGDARERWISAYEEYAAGWESRQAMDREMALSLRAVSSILECKAAFPRSFHYLKGNHDNITDEEGRGDHSFMKFVAEGEMVASWFFMTYGGDLLMRYRSLELSLPLMVLGRRFIATHAEPAFPLGAEDVANYRDRSDVVEALIWTPNDGALPGSVAQSMAALLGPFRARKSLWFAGHRPVEDRYALRAGGRFVQFHNPAEMRVVYLLPGRYPDPDRDILDLGD